MITTCNQSIPCCGPAPVLLRPFSHPRPSLFLHPVPNSLFFLFLATNPSFLPPAVGPQLCCPSLTLCHRFLSFANQNVELHLTKSIHQTLKFENQKKALADSTMASTVSATKFFY
ncbi:hypothetical protein AMTRI_Chr02g259590 [Amborella trichopoda]